MAIPWPASRALLAHNRALPVPKKALPPDREIGEPAMNRERLLTTSTPAARKPIRPVYMSHCPFSMNTSIEDISIPSLAFHTK